MYSIKVRQWRRRGNSVRYFFVKFKLTYIFLLYSLDLSLWNVNKVAAGFMTGMFSGCKAFNFKSALDASWASKNPSVYPGTSMFDYTCSSDAACGKCGHKNTNSDAVTCRLSSALPQLPPVRFVRTMGMNVAIPRVLILMVQVAVCHLHCPRVQQVNL